MFRYFLPFLALAFLFYSCQKEVKQKLISWVEKNVPDVPLWKIKIENHEIGWR